MASPNPLIVNMSLVAVGTHNNQKNTISNCWNGIPLSECMEHILAQLAKCSLYFISGTTTRTTNILYITINKESHVILPESHLTRISTMYLFHINQTPRSIDGDNFIWDVMANKWGPHCSDKGIVEYITQQLDE